MKASDQPDPGIEAKTSPGVGLSGTAQITNVAVQGANLAVGGTSGNDFIDIKPDLDAGDVEVLLNNQSLGTFHVPGQVLIFGSDGDDRLTVHGVQNSTFTKTTGTVTLGTSETVNYSGIDT